MQNTARDTLTVRNNPQQEALPMRRLGSFLPGDMTIRDWGISYAELEPYYEKFEYTAAVSGKAGNLAGTIQAGGNPFEAPRATRPRLPAAAADADPRQRDVFRCRAQRRLSSVSAAVGQCLTALHQSGRLEVRRLPILRLLPALRLRGQRQGQRTYDGDPDCDAQSEFRVANACLGHPGSTRTPTASASPA
jgi:choline dehydrogenase-like flavoprotein